MHALILADLGRDWSLAASVETFAIPVGLFLVVAGLLFFVYSRPHVVPGHRDLAPAGAGAGQAGAGPAAAEGENGTAPKAEDGS